MSEWVNLDQLCAKYGYDMCLAVNTQFKDKNKTENLITKSLGVLQEDGVYAFFLFQRSRGEREKKGAKKLNDRAGALLRSAEIKGFQEPNDQLKAVRDELANDIDQLLLAKRLLEQTLIYARYHAKALEGP